MYASYVNLIHYPYTMNLDKMTPIASKIATNQQVWQDKYRITGIHKDLRVKIPCGKKSWAAMSKNPLWRWRYKRWKPIKLGEAPNPLQFHSPMDEFGRSKPHPSHLLSPPLTSKGKNKPSLQLRRGSRAFIWAGLPTLQRGPQSQRIIQMSP